jgi:hypothetical protein
MSIARLERAKPPARSNIGRRSKVGWTVYYEATLSDGLDPVLSEVERGALAEHVRRWNERLHVGAEPYAYDEEESDEPMRLHGWTKIQSSEEPEEDFLTLIAAVRELAGLLPRFAFSVSDDYLLIDAVVPSALNIDDLRAQLAK